MDSTTGGDANDEFARWLAEQQGATAPAPAQPAPAQPAPQPPAAAPVPPAPEFFGADQLAAPPTRPYEPQLGGPQVARSSFQAPATPDPVPPATAVPPAAPPPTVAPPAAAAPPTAPASVAPSTPAPPSWAPAYAAPGGEPAAPAAPPSAPPQFFPDSTAPAAPVAAPPAEPAFDPGSFDPPSVEPTAAPQAPEAPQFSAPPVSQPAVFEQPVSQQPVSQPPVSAPPVSPAGPDYAAPVAPPAFEAPPPAYAEPVISAPVVESPPGPAAPSFDAQAYPPPATSAPAADAPATPYPPIAQPAEPPAPAPDPYAALFTTGEVGGDDTAARLAASPPPSLAPDPTPSGETPADEDPLKALFGLETEEQPAIPSPVDAAPAFTDTTAAPIELPTYTREPETVAPTAYTPEPAFAPAPAPEPAFAAAAASASSSYALTSPSAPPPDDDPTAGTQFFGGGVGEWEEPPDLDRTTLGERIAFALAFLVPPAGLIASIVAAVQSSRVRGWVHRFVRAALVISVIMTVVAGFAGAYLYKVVDDARKHDALAAASTQFCATIAEHPDMISPPSFGFPGPGASIPDTITAIQEYVDRWDALTAVSPSGIRPDVKRVADAARGILETVTQSRLVDNEGNVAVMSSVAQNTNVVGWAEEYCG